VLSSRPGTNRPSEACLQATSQPRAHPNPNAEIGSSKFSFKFDPLFEELLKLLSSKGLRIWIEFENLKNLILGAFMDRTNMKIPPLVAHIVYV
jgi:hypothetical protein